CTGHRPAGVGTGAALSVKWAYCTDCGAERPAGAACGRSRLSVGRRKDPRRGGLRRAACQRDDSRSLPRRLTPGNYPMSDLFDIYLLEALINGILLGGVLARLTLGLNLVFGVIDVVWICYAELIILGMYGMYFLYATYHLPFIVAAVICIASVGLLGIALH